MPYIAILALFFFSCAYGADYPVLLGDKSVIVHEIPGEGRTFVHVHQNETTALKAALVVQKQCGGRLITIRHGGGRNLVFHLKGRRYEADPNRIYTPVGIKKTLQQFGGYTPEAAFEVGKLSRVIKQHIASGPVIAVHNNQHYSLKDYLPHHPLAEEAQALSFSDTKAYRNFFLATQSTDFERLKTGGFNGVLQSPQAEDDGSLSVYLTHQTYINSEAGFGQMAAQVRFLKRV
jgi:hypothetical protein